MMLTYVCVIFVLLFIMIFIYDIIDTIKNGKKYKDKER